MLFIGIRVEGEAGLWGDVVVVMVMGGWKCREYSRGTFWSCCAFG